MTVKDLHILVIDRPNNEFKDKKRQNNIDLLLAKWPTLIILLALQSPFLIYHGKPIFPVLSS
jgi:hypothetical protein